MRSQGVDSVNLVASLIVRNELDRYMLDCVELLLGFCDEVRVWDDGSDDGTTHVLSDMDRVNVDGVPYSEFYKHEGNARQQALEHALDGRPTHIISVDADELIEDGPRLREIVEADSLSNVWRLCMEEVWSCDEDTVSVRTDGHWGPSRSSILYRVLDGGNGLRIKDQALASGRIPDNLPRSRHADTGISILHMGWANQQERSLRHARYVEHDGGRFHAAPHLDSIMFPDSRVTLSTCAWSSSITRSLRRRVAARANRV